MDLSTLLSLGINEHEDYKIQDEQTRIDEEYSCNECIQLTLLLMKHQLKLHRITNLNQHNDILKILLKLENTLLSDTGGYYYEIVTNIVSHTKLQSPLDNNMQTPVEIQHDSAKGIKIKRKKTSKKLCSPTKCPKTSIKVDSKLHTELKNPNEPLLNQPRQRQRENNFECEFCGKKFSLKKTLNRHYRSIHSIYNNDNHITTNRTEEDILICEICDQKFSNKRSIFKHFNRDHNTNYLRDKYTCDVCGRKYLTKNSIRAHLLNHSGIKQYNCKYGCSNGSFSYMAGLNRHYTQHHSMIDDNSVSSKIKVALCDFCGKYFGDTTKLNQHLDRYHNPSRRSYKCLECTKEYKTKESLRDHMYTHSGEKPYHCKFGCGQSFAYRGGLNQHIRHHHKPLPKYHCNTCEKVFTLKHSFLNHQRTHTGDRPFACQFCNLYFGARKTMINHQMTHTGAKRHYCDRCNKGFITFRELRLHKGRNKTCVLQTLIKTEQS